MNKQIFLDQLFPTSVLYADSYLITEQLIKLSKELIDQHATSPFYSPCKSTVNTFGDVLSLSEFKQIKDFASLIVNSFMEYKQIDSSKLKFTCSWLNYYDVGGYQDLHSHSDSMLSGVIWLQSDGAKDFIFQSPWHFMQPIMPNYIKNTDDNSHNSEYSSIPGRCMVFMSNALHRTLPATSPRISLSFNVA